MFSRLGSASFAGRARTPSHVRGFASNFFGCACCWLALLLLFVILTFNAASAALNFLTEVRSRLFTDIEGFLSGRMASVAVKPNAAANSADKDEKGTAKAADLVFEDDDFEEFPGE